MYKTSGVQTPKAMETIIVLANQWACSQTLKSDIHSCQLLGPVDLINQPRNCQKSTSRELKTAKAHLINFSTIPHSIQQPLQCLPQHFFLLFPQFCAFQFKPAPCQSGHKRCTPPLSSPLLHSQNFPTTLQNLYSPYYQVEILFRRRRIRNDG